MKQSKWIKLLVCLSILTLSIFYNSGISRAAPEDEQYTWAVTSKLDSNYNTLDNTYYGSYGLYYNLYYLTSAIRWTEFLALSDNFSEYEKTVYFDKLKASVESFNSRFSLANANAPEMKDVRTLDITPPTNLANISNFSKRSVNDSIPKYIKAELDKMLTDKLNISGQLDQETKTKLRYIYKILEVLVSDQNEMQSYISEGDLKVTISTQGEAILNDSKYVSLLEKGRELDSAETMSVNNVDLGVELPSYVEKFAWVTKKTADDPNSKYADLGADNWNKQQGHIGEDDTFMLKDLYVRMVSASAVYTPGKSYVGSEEFLAALEGLFPKDQSAEALALFDQLKDYRKPLYSIYRADNFFGVFGQESTDLTTFGWYKGKASPVKLVDLMEAIKTEKPIALLAMKGKMATSETDANSFVYYSDSVKFDSQPVTSTPVEQPTEPEEQNEDEQQTDNSEASTTLSSGNELNRILAIASDKEIVSKNWTGSILESSGNINSLTQFKNTTLPMVVYYNYYKDLNFLENSEEKKSYLWVNVFGDIVTDDNLVIIPAAANPTNFNTKEGYNPFTVMFLKGYPGLYYRSGDIALSNTEMDKGKYALISGENTKDSNHIFVKVKDVNDLKSTDPRFVNWIDTDLTEPISNVDGLFTREKSTEKFRDNWRTYIYNRTIDNKVSWDMNIYKDALVVLKSNYSDIMDYNPAEDENFAIAKYLARNMYFSLKTVNGQITDELNGKLKQDHMFRDIIVEALNGTIYAKAYTRTISEATEDVEELSYNALSKIPVRMANSALSGIGNTSGALGVTDSRDDVAFGKIFRWIDEFLVYIMIICAVIFLVRLVRNNTNTVYLVTTMIVSLALVFTSIKIVPSYIQPVMNFVVNNTSMDLSYGVLLNKAEEYNETYGNSGALDENGNFTINTVSVDLYHLRDGDLQSFLDQFNLEIKDITAGRTYMLDPNNGIYIQGNTLKINTDLLFYTNPITGDFQSTDDSSTYALTPEKQYSSVVDYYMPFYLIEEGFTKTLNNLLKVYRIPKYSITYKDGLTKDGFLVQNYITSPPFLTPNNYKQGDGLEDAAEVQQLYYIFDNEQEGTSSYDFLNLGQILTNPSAITKESLWWKTAVRNGYVPGFSADPNTEQKFASLVNSVNKLTKDFLIKYRERFPYISDENIIKVTSLYATTIFNQKVSEPFHQLYPKYINYSEFKLKDVYSTAFVEDYESFKDIKGKIPEYVASKVDPFTMFIFAVSVILGSLFARAFSLLLPCLLLLFLILALFKAVTGSSYKSIFKGLAKIMLLLFVCITMYSTSMSLLEKLNVWFAIYSMFILYLIILSLFSTILYSLVTNFTDFGNEKLNSITNKVLEKTSADGIFNSMKSTVASMNVLRRTNTEQVPALAGDRYALDREVGYDSSNVGEYMEAYKQLRNETIGNRRSAYRYREPQNAESRENLYSSLNEVAATREEQPRQSSMLRRSKDSTNRNYTDLF